MRRDMGFYIEANIAQVYQAYLSAATHKPFERDCKQEPYHTISFGLNYSFKYNMNGGACTIHFMPCGSGTAVNMRFSIAQAFGGRYENYAKDLNNAMQAFLPVMPRPANYNMDDFLRPENQVTPATLAAPTAPVIAQAAPAARYCSGCGHPLAPGGLFCSQCGLKMPVPDQKRCPNCQTPAQNDAVFCAECGTRL